MYVFKCSWSHRFHSTDQSRHSFLLEDTQNSQKCSKPIIFRLSELVLESKPAHYAEFYAEI